MDKARFVNLAMREQLNQKSIKYNWHEAHLSVLEGVLARGDRKVGKVIRKAYEKGCLFDSWSDHFKNDQWLDAFDEEGISVDFYTRRERTLDEVFPWDFIDVGVTKDFLKREWKHAMNAEVTPNCRESCSGCGAKQFGGGVCYEN